MRNKKQASQSSFTKIEKWYKTVTSNAQTSSYNETIHQSNKTFKIEKQRKLI